jgi:hypothetical protein
MRAIWMRIAKPLSLFFILTLLLAIKPSLHSAYADPGGMSQNELNQKAGKTGSTGGKTASTSRKP